MNNTSWVDIYKKIISIPEGMCIDLTRDNMAVLMDCNRSGIDRLMTVSDDYIKEAIKTWPMLSEYRINHNLLKNTYNVYLPKAKLTAVEAES